MLLHITRLKKILYDFGQRKSYGGYKTLFRPNFGSYSLIKRPGNVGPNGIIPSYIQSPEYWPDGYVNLYDPRKGIEIKTPPEIEAMRTAGAIARKVMDAIGKNLEIGVTTEEVDTVGHDACLEHDSYPSPLLYKGFPKSICTSVNNVACHGIPDDRSLQEGDIISVDVTVYHDGHHGDCCETWCLPGVDDQGKRLVECARRARDEAIAICGPGVSFAKIGEVCEEVARAEGFSIVPYFIGHGIGSFFHGPPDIYHYGNNDRTVMAPGMCFTIEPVVAQGSEAIIVLEDDWTAMMVDGGRAAQFEHTVLVTENGHDVLTDYLPTEEL